MADDSQASSDNTSTTRPKTYTPWTDAILSKEEIRRFVDLGMGRGVDTTDPDLWRNKCAFIVRHATFSNIIGTDEGNLCEDYRKTILSGCDLQEEFKQSIANAEATAPIPIVLEGSASRSATSNKIVKGTRVLTRTISYNFSSHCSNDKKSFEDYISKWVNKHDLEGSCCDFIQHFGVTHYVNSITLGASEHSIYTEEEHAAEIQKKKSKGFKSIKKKFIEVISGGATEVKEEVKEVKDVIIQKLTGETKEESTHHSRVRKLGVMKDGKVDRGTTNEAVIGIKILPIHSLIEKNKDLREALRKALAYYSTKNRGFTSTGPFLVESGDEGLYWKVKEDHTLTATRLRDEASFFHVIPNEDIEDDPYDFYIAWERKDGATLAVSATGSLRRRKSSSFLPSSRKTTQAVLRYLQVDGGEGEGGEGESSSECGLQMKTCVRSSTMCIYKPLIKEEDPATRADLNQWLTKRKVFFIQSARNNKFLSVQITPDDDDGDKYQVKFLERSQSHDEKTTWMLFRLLAINDDITSVTKSTL